MKLHQLVTLAEAKKPTKKQALEDLLATQHITDYTVNKNGTINVNGDLELHWGYKDEWPRIHTVHGSFKWTQRAKDSSYSTLPKIVEGDCTFMADLDIKTSMIPKGNGGKLYMMSPISGTTWQITRGGNIVVDDNTLSTYGSFSSESRIVGGLEHLPRQFTNCKRLSIEMDDLTGIPPVIECESFRLYVNTPGALKGIHKKINSIRSQNTSVEFPEKTPVLRLLSLFSGQELLVTITGIDRNGQKNIQFRSLIAKLARNGVDIFEAQQTLIDAGFGEYAK